MAPPRSNTGRWIVTPKGAGDLSRLALKRTQERRRRVLTFLAIVALSTGIGALFFGTSVEIHLLADAVLAFYVALLLEVKRRRQEVTTKVRPLAPEVTPEAVAFYEPIQAGSRGR